MTDEEAEAILLFSDDMDIKDLTEARRLFYAYPDEVKNKHRADAVLVIQMEVLHERQQRRNRSHPAH